ncbi:OLC1v1035225C1 [Oldenlandia corymbosa var. corymbosa]|uniref:Protein DETOXIFICATION n=1 Tax=Oldenlandia corymbosa var. corymbosa TaxID=529605 RepID=A0AAV1CTB3_OLDCO|nr:OLC1v1035225C1 [Oldenlandia corymbosa var. corymbosa]
MERPERASQDLECPLIDQCSDRSNAQIKFRGQCDEIIAEAKKLLILAGPLVIVNLLIYSLQVISIMFVGHLGELALSGASMATSFASVTGFSLLTGMGTALDTFCGQSYGAKQYHMLGVHMQGAMLVLLLVSFPLAFIWANAGSILLFVGQDPEISAEAGVYARHMIPSVFAFALLQCHMRFLQSQNNVIPMMLCSCFTTILHVFNCWFFVVKSGLGSRGAAVANDISYWINVLLLAAYVRFSPTCKKTWNGFSRDSLKGVPRFLKLAIPSGVMICLEIWSFEMMVLLSGLLPNPKLETSVLSISLNTSTMIFMIPFGLGSAVSVRVANELGAGRPNAAQLAAYIALFVIVIEGVLTAAILTLGRNIWGYCYTTEENVVKYVGAMLLLISVSHLIDDCQSVLSGAARGCGKQKICAIVDVGAYYILGLPAGIFLAFVHQVGGKGLWMGLTVALSAQAISLFIINLRTDWEKEAKKAKERAHCISISKEEVT